MTLLDPSTFAEPLHHSMSGAARAASRMASLVFCLAGCELWLDIPDNPRWLADAGTQSNVPSEPASAQPSGSIASIAPVMPMGIPMAAPAEPALPPPPDMSSSNEPLDAGTAASDPAPLEPEPPADPAPVEPAGEPPAADPPAGDPPAGEPPAADPPAGDPPVEPPNPAEPEPAPVAEPPPTACRGAELTGPNGRCYLAVSASSSWNAARRNCRDRGDGWDLAAIRSAAINRFIGDMVSGQAWIGASDAATEGEWVWVGDGAPFWVGTAANGSAVDGAYENWSANEPNGGFNINCTRIQTPTFGAANGGPVWADRDCGESRASVCEGPPR
jgi:hypothetical protein